MAWRVYAIGTVAHSKHTAMLLATIAEKKVVLATGGKKKFATIQRAFVLFCPGFGVVIVVSGFLSDVQSQDCSHDPL